MTTTITGIDTFDVRFPTSREMHGSDAMHTDPDYSAAYVILRMGRPGSQPPAPRSRSSRPDGLPG